MINRRQAKTQSEPDHVKESRAITESKGEVRIRRYNKICNKI